MINYTALRFLDATNYTAPRDTMNYTVLVGAIKYTAPRYKINYNGVWGL